MVDIKTLMLLITVLKDFHLHSIAVTAVRSSQWTPGWEWKTKLVHNKDEIDSIQRSINLSVFFNIFKSMFPSVVLMSSRYAVFSHLYIG